MDNQVAQVSFIEVTTTYRKAREDHMWRQKKNRAEGERKSKEKKQKPKPMWETNTENILGSVTLEESVSILFKQRASQMK